MPASSPGSLVGNPPPRWGAPGDDQAACTRTAASADPSRAPGPELSPEDRHDCCAARPSRDRCPGAAPPPARRAPTCRSRWSRVARALRQPRLRGERAGPGGGGRPRRASCCPSTRACTAAPATPRRSARRVLEQAREHGRRRFVGARADDVVVFTRNTTDALNLLAGCVPGARACASTSSTTRTCCPWRAAPACCRPPPDRRGDPRRPARRAARRARRAARRHRRVQRDRRDAAAGRDRRDRARGGARIVVDAAQLAPHRRDRPRRHRRRLPRAVRAQALRAVRRGRAGRAPRLARRRRPVPRRRRRRARGRRTDDGDAAEVPGRPPAPARGRHPERRSVRPRSRRLPTPRRRCSTAPLGARARPARPAARRPRRRPRRATLRIWPDAADRVGRRRPSPSTGTRPAWSPPYLSAEHGIGVRDGRFCAHPLLDRLAGTARRRRGAGEPRARHHRRPTSTGWSRRSATLVTHGPGWTYALVDGRWAPTPDPRAGGPAGCGSRRSDRTGLRRLTAQRTAGTTGIPSASARGHTWARPSPVCRDCAG